MDAIFGSVYGAVILKGIVSSASKLLPSEAHICNVLTAIVPHEFFGCWLWGINRVSRVCKLCLHTIFRDFGEPPYVSHAVVACGIYSFPLS